MNIQKMTSDLSGLKRYETWRAGWVEGDALDTLAYLSDAVSPEDCLIFSKVLFPDFVEVEGGVFLSWRYEVDSYKEWHDELGGDVSKIESVLNKVHLYDLFTGAGDDVEDVVYSRLAEVLALSWRMSLACKFPEKSFLVDVSYSDMEYGPVVTFYQAP